MKRYLLDTNMLLGFIRGAEWARQSHAKLGMADATTMVFTTSINRGEILALAEKLGWGAAKRGKLETTLLQFPAVGIDRDSVARAYARIDAWSQGKPVAEAPFAEPPKPARRMGQNDMWIAAVAHVVGATLVTTDGDFDHLAGGVIVIEKVDQSAA